MTEEVASDATGPNHVVWPLIHDGEDSVSEAGGPADPDGVSTETSSSVDHSASTHKWVVRTSDGDQMAASDRLRTSWPLLRMYAVRQVHLRYRQSLLGLSWTLVQPIAIMAIYGVVFTQFFDVSAEGGAPYLSMAWTGLTVWMYVQGTIQVGCVALLNDAYMINRVWFPREIIPLSPVLAGVVDFGAAAVLLVPIVLLQGGGPSIALIALPLIIAVLVAWVAAICVITSTLTIFFRDMATIVALGLRLMFIATPVMYDADQIPPQFGWVLAGNPFAVVVNNFRTVILDQTWPNWELLALQGLAGILLLYGGIRYLRAVERRMVDVI